MYPSSSSSSSQGSMAPGGTGLFRYGSAPGSLLTAAVDSVNGPNREFSALGSHTILVGSRCFSSDTSSLTSESDPKEPGIGLQRSYGLNESGVGELAAAGNNLKITGGGSSPSSSLVRHNSLPPGFLNHIIATAPDNGFSITRGIGSYNSKGPSDSVRGISRLNSQLSFTRQDSLSNFSEESEVNGISTDNGQRKAAHSYATANFGVGSWDDTNPIVFSGPPSKQAKNTISDTAGSVNTIKSQFQFSLPHTTLEVCTTEKFLQFPQDSIPYKIRAKRGCATHPRSIAERERRTRISGRLKKLQELVPNMDKQTGYADMLDLAVQHIKGLQDHIQKLNKELKNCKCGGKQTT